MVPLEGVKWSLLIGGWHSRCWIGPEFALVPHLYCVPWEQAGIVYLPSAHFSAGRLIKSEPE